MYRGSIKLEDHHHTLETGNILTFNIERLCMGGIGIWQLLIVALIIILLFGTKKLRGIGGDLGSAIKGYKNAIADGTPESVFDTMIDREDKVTPQDKL